MARLVDADRIPALWLVALRVGVISAVRHRRAAGGGHAGRRDAAGAPMITIAIATHKGGTGKTVTAMALAAAFARAGSSTLLVDLDPQGHSTLGLGVDVGDDQPTLRELLIENRARPLVEIVTATKTPNLSMVPASIVAERNAQLLYMRPKREEVLRRALLKLYPSPAVVVIDCPPSLGPLTENGIAAADWIVVPCQMEA